MSHDASMFIFCLSSVYLEMKDIVSLLQCSKAMASLRDSLQTAFLSDSLKLTTDRIVHIRRLFPRLSELSVYCAGEWNADWCAFDNLHTLRVLGSRRSSRIVQEAPPLTANSRLSTLALEGICGSQCNGMYSFIAQFAGLRSLTLRRVSPFVLSGLGKSVESLPFLEDLQLRECFTDAEILPLRNLRRLKRLRVSNCPNIRAILPQNHLDGLSEITIENTRIGASTLEVVLLHCPMLKSLNIAKCSNLRGGLSVSHRQLHSLRITYCSNLHRLNITCPGLSDLHVHACYSMQSCTVMSDRLTALDLSQHSALTELHLQCCRLSALDFTGCSSLTINMTSTPHPSTASALSSEQLARDLDEMMGKISLTSESEDAFSDSDRSSSRSARLVSSRRVLDSALTSASSGEHHIQHMCERLLAALQTTCPALDLRAFIRDSIRGTLMEEHRDLLLERADVLSPQKHDAAAFVEHASTIPRSLRSPGVAARKKVSPDTKGSGRKPRRAKK